jgi:4'-phosphopantetheinyl transferase
MKEQPGSCRYEREARPNRESLLSSRISLPPGKLRESFQSSKKLQPSDRDEHATMPLQSAFSQTSQQSWELAPQSLELPLGEVHIWRGRLFQQRAQVAELWPLLSEEEQLRAAKFHFPEDSDRYILTHGMLRDILLRYQSLVPAPLCISLGPKGQPYLLQPSDSPRLRFSLSHSQSLALFALNLDCKVGIDVEPTSSPADWQAIANRFFSGPECQYLFELPEVERELAFRFLWTRKEAYVKARGEGFSLPLDSFSILESPDGTLHVDDGADSAAGLRWSFLDLIPDEHHLGSIAIEGCASRVLFWECNLASSNAQHPL